MCDGEKVLHRLRQAEVAVQLPAELLHQQEHIVPPLRQGRDDHRQGVQPVVEVPAEGALRHLPLQRLVGGGHDPHVDMDDGGVAHPHDLPLLQGPQQLDLKSGAHALHLVQKQRAPVGQLKEAGAAALFGSGEGPLLVAEQLAFQQILRKRRHVDGQKRPGRPAGGPVNGVGEQLLPVPVSPIRRMGLSLLAIRVRVSLVLRMAADCPITSSKLYLA